VRARRYLEHQQHPLGAAQFGDLVDQELVQIGGTAQLVQAHPGVDQALEGRAQIRFSGEVCRPPLRR
jgi:hypothetical protein